MKFRPCIDIHNGAVKQIVGGSLNKDSSKALENFATKQSAKKFFGFSYVYRHKETSSKGAKSIS